MTPEEEQKLRNFRLLGGGSSMELPQQQQPIAPILGQAGSGGQGFAVSPSILGQIPGIENITLGQAPIVSQEGIQYQTPERGRDDMNAEERISDAWNQSVLGQKMEGAFGQQVFGVGNDQYQIRNKFLGTVGGQVPYSEASPQAKSEAMKAYFLGGITERPVGQTYEQAVEQTYEQAQGLPPIQLEALERLSPQQETTTTPPFKGLNPVGIGMGDGKEFSANTLSRGITPTSTFGGDLDLAARYADSISGAMGTPMTGMRPIDPNTGEPLSQRVIDIANRIGLQLPEASVPLAPQAPMSPRDLAVAEGEARLERIRSGQGLSDAALIATGKMEAPEGYYDRPTEAPVPEKSTMTVGEQAQANFERFKASGQKMTPEQVVQAKNLAASSGRTFNEETGYSKEFNPAIQAAYLARQSPTDGQGSRLTTVGGASLSEFLGGAAMPKQGYGMRTDAQGRMINPNVDRSDFNIASAYRENLLAAKPDFNRAVSDRERRGTGEMSRSEATRIAEAQGYKGQQARDVADGYITLQRQGRDPMTGQPMQTGEQGLTFDQKLALEKFNYEKAKDQVDYAQADAETKAKRTDDMNTEVGALTSIIGQTENVTGLTEKAAGRVGANTVGFFSPLKFIGGTDAADLAGDLETIKSDAFVANITEMRQNSPTGGAVGNVSDKDLEMLQSLQTSFRQNLKPSTLRSNLKKYQTIRNKVAEDAKAGFIRKYGEENFNRYFEGGGGNPSGQSTEQGNFDYGDDNYEIIPGR